MHNFSLFCHFLHICAYNALIPKDYHIHGEGSPQIAIQAAADALALEMPGVWAISERGAWALAPNDVWNIPAHGCEQRAEIEAETAGWGRLRSYRALAVGLTGQVFGMRTLSGAKSSGYELEGHVSIKGRRLSAFTSSRMFRRADGSLINVAVLIVRSKGLLDMRQAC